MTLARVAGCYGGLSTRRASAHPPAFRSYHSWAGVQGVQTGTEAAVQVQEVEQSLRCVQPLQLFCTVHSSSRSHSPAQQEQLKLKLKQKHLSEEQ